MYINNCFTVKKPNNWYGANNSLWVNGKLNVKTDNLGIDKTEEQSSVVV